jgi:hypothetical protein
VGVGTGPGLVLGGSVVEVGGVVEAVVDVVEVLDGGPAACGL